jgi:hypothetical protein
VKHFFTDTKGRDWEINVSPYEYELVEQDGVCLYDMVEGEDRVKFALSMQMKPTFLTKIIWRICEEQAEKREVSRKEFFQSINDQAQYQSFRALAGALKDFFPSPVHKQEMQNLMDYLKEIDDQLVPAALEIMEKNDITAAVQNYIESVLNSQDTSESTLTPMGEPGPLHMAN